MTLFHLMTTEYPLSVYSQNLHYKAVLMMTLLPTHPTPTSYYFESVLTPS